MGNSIKHLGKSECLFIWNSSKNCRGWNTSKLIQPGHNHPDTKTTQRQHKKNKITGQYLWWTSIQKSSNVSANYRIYGNNLSEKLKSAIDYIQNKSISDKRDISIEIENLFIEIANASNSVSNVDLRLMNQVIEKYYEKFGYGQINCRKIYMRLINKQ